MTKHSIDLGTLQTALQTARRTHSINQRNLTKAQEASARSKKALDDAQASLDAGARSVLQNG